MSIKVWLHYPVAWYGVHAVKKQHNTAAVCLALYINCKLSYFLYNILKVEIGDFRRAPFID